MKNLEVVSSIFVTPMEVFVKIRTEEYNMEKCKNINIIIFFYYDF